MPQSLPSSQSLRSQSNFGPDLSSSATAPILRGAPLVGESGRTFFAFFKPSCRKHTDNHHGAIIAIDFFTVPTASFRVLFVMVVLAHHRRRIVHFNVTANPTAFQTAQQVVEAFPEESAPRFLIRDRDQIPARAPRPCDRGQ